MNSLQYFVADMFPRMQLQPEYLICLQRKIFTQAGCFEKNKNKKDFGQEWTGP